MERPHPGFPKSEPVLDGGAAQGDARTNLEFRLKLEWEKHTLLQLTCQEALRDPHGHRMLIHPSPTREKA